MAKGSGWNVGNVHTLRQRIEQVKKTPNNPGLYRSRVIQEIRNWWNEPNQELPRETDATAEDAIAGLVALAADIGNPVWINQVRAARGQEPMHVNHLDDAVNLAEKSKHARTGLESWAASEIEQGRSVPQEVQRVLFTPMSTKRGRAAGIKPADDRRRQQLAAIVWVLRECTPFKSTNRGGYGGTENAFEVAAEATEQPANQVADAWRRLKEYWGE